MGERFQSFCDQYPNEESCYDYFFRVKWPEGFICPRCSYRHAYIIRSRRTPLYECRACRHQTTLTADTALERSRLPLRKWLFAFIQWSDYELGINATELSLEIQVTYKTAWSMLHKVRNFISRAEDSQPLSAKIVGELAFIGRPHNFSFELHPKEHPVIIAASLQEADVPSRVKIKLVEPAHLHCKMLTRSGLSAFTGLYTDRSSEQPDISKSYFRLHRNARFKQWRNTVRSWLHQKFRGIGRKHLQLYLDEFCYRLNGTHRCPSSDGPLSRTSIHLCMHPSECS
ncbi:transposase [Paenibacillus beijingensis]|uniref:transposase n=1 Tax=Paenibacillus beijingensis TaxID=1126833 RepID=UPI0009E36F62|nr:transposase [Paenibacillus beijingensis]